MLYVKTTIASSPIHGIGLFANQRIPKGTVVWKFTPGFDMKFTREQLLDFPELLQIYLSSYLWKSTKSGLYCFCSDNAKHFNHSTTPNCLSRYLDNEDEVVTIALKDIEIGEELVDDYSSFEDGNDEDSVLDSIYEKYNLADEMDPRDKHP